MRLGKALAVTAISMIMTTGLAMAQGSGSTNGTPDAQGGAVGRNQPSSLDGKGVRASAGLTTPKTAMSHGKTMRHHRRHHRHHRM